MVAWARYLGVRLPINNNWAEKALNKLEVISGLEGDQQYKEFNRFYRNPIDAQNNISDLKHLHFIKRNIGDQNPSLLKEKLSLSMTGPDSIRQESRNNTRSRDARFELSICAQLNSMGFNALLCHPNPDILATRKKIRAAIECKRIFSETRLIKQIDAAAHQLKIRKGNQEADLRLIFCDMTRALTSGNSHLNGELPSIIPDLTAELNCWSQKIMQELLRRQIRSIDAVVLVYQDYIESNKPEYRLTAITQQSVIISPNSSRPLRRKAARLALKFDRQSKLFTTDLLRH